MSPIKNSQSNRITAESVNNILATKLNAGNPNNMLDMANALETISTDIYSDNNRFIFELIQNADDSADKTPLSIQLQVIDDFFILSHNGKPFSKNDLRGLCSIGSGGKTQDTNKIGYKGIGFKSVFNQNASLVYVKSEETLFKFDKATALERSWNKDWVEKTEWEKEQELVFKTPWQNMPILSSSTNNELVDEVIKSNDFNVHTVIRLDDSKEIVEALTSFFEDTRYLLFLRNVVQIEFVNRDEVRIFRKEEREDGIHIIKEGESVISNWLLYSYEVEIPDDVKDILESDAKLPEKFKNISKTEVSFAFQVQSTANKVTIIPLSKEDSCIYTYLPTTVNDYEFPFIVNSNFIVDAGREKIRKDNKWNQWLFELTGALLIKSCQRMHQEKFDVASSLSAIKEPFSRKDHLSKAYDRGLMMGLSAVRFIVNNEGELVYLREIVFEQVGLLADKIVSSADFVKHLNETAGAEYKIANVLPNSANASKLIKLGARAFDNDYFAEYLKKPYFQQHHLIENNEQLIKLLYRLESVSGKNKWSNLLREIPLICDNNNELVKIESVCFPIEVDGLNEFDELKFIEKKLYNKLKQDEKIIGWLKSYGVSEPSKLAYLEKEIIPQIGTINDIDFISKLTLIIELHEQRRLTRDHYLKLKKLPLKCLNNKFNAAEDCVYPIEFKPEVNFNSLPSGVVNIIHSDCLGYFTLEQCKSIFNKIGVIDSINFSTSQKIPLDPEFIKEAISFAKKGLHSPSLVTERYKSSIRVDLFSFFPSEKHQDFLKVYWNYLTSKHLVTFLDTEEVSYKHSTSQTFELYKIGNSKVTLYDTIEWGYYGSRVAIPSYFKWWVTNKAVLPTKKHGFESANKVWANKQEILELVGDDYPIISLDKELSDGWIKLLGINSDVSFFHVLDLLSTIPTKVVELTQKDYTRIDKLYLRLLEEYKSFTDEIKNTLLNLYDNKSFSLLCQCGSFQSEDLIFVKLEKYSSSDIKQNIIYVPEELKGNPLFSKLLKDILNVKVIDDFKINHTKAIEERELKYKLLHGLPYIYSLAKSDDITFEQCISSLYNFSLVHCEKIKLSGLKGDDEIHLGEVESHLDNGALYFTHNITNPLKLNELSKIIAKQLKLGADVGIILICLQSTIGDFSESCKETCGDIESLPGLDCLKELIKKYDSLQLESTLDNELKEEVYVESPPVYKEPTISIEGIEDASTMALFSVIQYLEKMGSSVKKDDETIEKYKLTKKIANIQDESLPYTSLLYRSVKSGQLHLSYPAWCDLDKDSTALYMYRGENLAPVVLYTKQELFDYASKEPMLCSLQHDGATKPIEDLINGNFVDQNFADLPKLNLILKLPSIKNNESLDSLMNSAAKEFSLDELQ